MLDELAGRTAAFGLHGRFAAQGVGARLGGLRNHALDLTLERNQALRTAVLDVVHVARCSPTSRRWPTAAATPSSRPGIGAGRSGSRPREKRCWRR